ncbi:terminase gpP N-terminus-related DNA-binding protein [Escherichia coli]|uniref:terminase gpP N-terminus-related DNA-binding protein n=1 Tax=Escherichia coli TaxID=562 RepID=UPI000390C331|nr:helix-turn-helix domain-containing protein [Escherichia coli]EQU65687.1 hypothetical protein G861_03023 [Escherichia coli HVH 209 (4-3062651)]
MTITTDTTLLHDPRRQAALLYWQGFSVPQIAAMLQMKRPTVQSWKQRDGWDSVAPISRVEMSLEARLTQLIIKPQKTGGDFKEIDLLGRQIERLARVNRYSQTGNEADLNPNVANRNKGGRRKPKKNFFSDEAIEKLEQIFFEQSFDYQLHWYTPEMKTAMVLKAKDVIRRGCLEYDVSATDITSSFMAIRKTMTSSGRSATYEASRSEEASHADLAWATMHALLNEPLTAGISTPLTSTILEFY